MIKILISNYLTIKKQIGSIANISLILEKQNKKLKIKEFSFKEKKYNFSGGNNDSNDKFISMENFIAKPQKKMEFLIMILRFLWKKLT